MVWLTPTRRFGVTRGRWLRWSPTSLSVLILRRRCMWVLPTLMLLRRWRSWSAYCWPLTAMWTFASEGWWVLLLEPTPALGRRLSPSLRNDSAGRRWNPLPPWVLAEPVTILKGVGPATAAKLKELGIVSLGDLLCHLPFRYETAGDIISISSMPEGEKVVIRGRVTSHSLRRSRNRRLTILEALIRDNSGAVRAVWYNQGYLQEIFESRPEILARGTLRRRGSDVAFRGEGHEILNEGETAGLHTVGIIPVYPSTGDFSVRRLRSALAQAVRSAVHMTDPLPSRLVAANRMSSRASAVVGYHFPLDLEQARAARKRLAYEELVLLQLALLMRRQDLGLRPPG